MYMCCGAVGAGYFSNNPLPYYAIYRSDDSGATWSATSMTTFQGHDPNSGSARTLGPKMRVDPANKDICYISNSTGVFFVTYNGGTNWHIVNTLLGALPHGNITADVNTGGSTTLTFSPAVPAGVTTWNGSQNGYFMYAYDANNPLALGSGGDGWDAITGVSATQISVQRILPNTLGGSGPHGIISFDTVYFGVGGCVEIDDSQGTVPNPGLDPGCTGVASANVYFGWMLPSTVNGFWYTTDGNPEHAFPMPSGGPPFVVHMQRSNDKALVGGGNVLYATGNFSNDNGFRWVPNTPPTGSNLTANTWTQLTMTGGNGGDIRKLCPDPKNAGVVVAVSSNFVGDTNYNNSYGTGAGAGPSCSIRGRSE